MAETLRPFSEERPEDVALVDESGATTWAELNARVNQLIHALRALGLKSGDSFAVLVGNRREFFEICLAAAHGSWFVVPVNWHWVPEELAYVLENSDARVLFVEPRFSQTAAEALARNDAPALLATIGLGEAPHDGFTAYEPFLAAESAEEPEKQGAGAPMFYTSGTTGRPKGVRSGMLQPGAPVAVFKLIAARICQVMGLPERGVTLLEGPAYHSAQWAFSFFPLLCGGSVVMRHQFGAQETLELIDRYRVTNLHLVPTQFVRMLKLDDDVRARFDGSSLKTVLHGAAPCPPEVKRRMIDWFGRRITEYYGATEGAIISTITADDWLSKPGSLGKPLDHIEIIVVKDGGERAGLGEPGQLYFRSRLGGDFEYYKDAEKTAAAHLEPGVYTFGDVGFVDEDGHLFMSDRKIDMIISGGVNIYPAEIEGVLVAHPAVSDAAVFGIPNEEFGEEVKAAVELVPGREASEALARELTAYCREHLAGYKAPRSIDFEEALPRHPTGKLYKRLLRDRYWKGAGRQI